MEGGDNGKKRRPRRRAVRRKKASKQKRITQFLLPVPEERKEGSRPQVQKLASKRKKGWAEFQADKDYFSDGELYFSSDKRRQAKVEYQVKPYFRPCTRFFSQHDVATRPEDFLLMARSYRSYQEGEQVRLAEMTLREANAYLVLKGQMLEERGRETGTQEEEQKEEHVQLSHSEARKYREFRFLREFTREDRPGGMRIARRLGMRPKVVYRLMQRLRRHGDIVPRKRGTRSRVTPEMLAFLQGWFTTDGNVGKSFKYAYGALVAAFGEDGKIGNSVMKNLIDGGYEGEIYPIHPREEEILGRKCHASVTDVSGNIDIAIFCIPARFVAGVLAEVGQKGIAGAILIPSGFAEVGEHELQEEVVQAARDNNVRLMGPNIYGFYYTHKNLCATFCTPYDEKGSVALSSQSGGVGMAIIGFSRSAKMGVSAIVGLGNKSDIDEDDLLVYFEQDPNTEVIAMHVEDLKDGQAFAEVATRVSKTKPVVVLKAGRTSIGAKAANSHTGALAGDDRVYDSILKQSGVIRARSLNDLLEYARGLSVLPTPKGENILILTGAGGSGVLLSDACVDNDLTLMSMPDDLDAAFKEFIPPFGASGNPVDITGGEPPTTYRATIELALNDERIHSLVLGYWHTIITPPMVFAELLSEEVEAARNKGINKPVVVSLVGDVEVEEACRYLLDRDILAYPYTAEKPVAVLGAKYRWARSAGLL